jgi:hypothetical protein
MRFGIVPVPCEYMRAPAVGTLTLDIGRRASFGRGQTSQCSLGRQETEPRHLFPASWP